MRRLRQLRRAVSSTAVLSTAVLSTAVLSTLVLTAGLARADVYSDGNLTVDWARTGDDLSGTLSLHGDKFPAVAHATGVNIAGRFSAGPDAFDFTATLAGDTLTLVSGSRTYTLARKDAPANPLAAPANPLAAPANSAPAAAGATAAGVAAAAAPAPADLPAGYTAVNTTNAGVSLKTTKPAAKTVQEALSATLADVARLLDAKPAVGGAVEDQQTHQSGVAVFTGTQKGKAVRGIASCQMTAGGADVSVVVCDAAAPPEAWQKLSAAPNAVTAAADKVPTREYSFPDGTGTVGLPEGWTTKAASILDPMEFEGPDDAKLTVNGSVVVNTPDGMLMQVYRQSVQMSQRVGSPPPPPPPGLFAEFMAPSDSIKVLLPQVNKFCQANRLPTTESDKIISVQPATPQLPSGRAQLIEDTAYRVAPDGTRTLMHGVGRYESAMLGRDAWMLQINSMVARDDQFAKMQPVMVAILNSGKVNQAQCDRISQQRAEQQRQQLAQTAANNRTQLDAQFEAGQAAHKQQMAGYDRYNHNWAVDQNLKSRSNDNFIEYIGGTRNVYDTANGTRQAYDLNSADGVAGSLNAATNDPDRFKSIPLRDERDPLPQR